MQLELADDLRFIVTFVGGVLLEVLRGHCLLVHVEGGFLGGRLSQRHSLVALFDLGRPLALTVALPERFPFGFGREHPMVLLVDQVLHHVDEFFQREVSYVLLLV